MGPGVTETVTSQRQRRRSILTRVVVMNGSARSWLFLCLLAFAAAPGCGEGAGGGLPTSLTVVPITDINPDPSIVEVNLVASPGQTRYLKDGPADVWGYRDGAVAGSVATVPGPFIEAKPGDSVIIHFTNELPEATTIHWHGLRVPNAADGTPSTQVEVAPGGTFDYRFTTDDAGTFWYHPHLHSDVQIERGLYGALVVRGGPEIPVNADRTFVLDDVKLEATGQLSEVTSPLDLMLGRQGNVILANGRAGGKLEVGTGARERWRFANSANGRYFNLQVPGHTFTVIGWDGGMLAEPYVAQTLLVAPGERYDVLVDLTGMPGDTFPLQTIHYDRGHDIPDPGPKTVFDVVLGKAAAQVGPTPTTWGTRPDLPTDTNTAVREIVLNEKEAMNPGEEPRFFINDTSFPAVAPIQGTSDRVEVWRVVNDSEMDHPFHLHGMFFEVLDVGGVAPLHRGWKDTVNVPMKTTLRFAVRYGTAGTWMYHCHILEHAERGMMGTLVLSSGT